MKIYQKMQNEAYRMKTWQTRNVLEYGGKRSATPLLDGAGFSKTRCPAISKAVSSPPQSKTWRSLDTTLALFCLAISANAQNYSIDWYKVAGGGGTSSNSQYTVSGTIGQHDAGGPMTGGNYSLTGGFWALVSVIQTPGLPNLIITHSGNSVIVSWPDTGSYTLQQNSNLANTGGWFTSGHTITTADGTNSITITPPTGNLFFRLSYP